MEPNRRGVKKGAQVETTRKEREDKSRGSGKGEYGKELRTAMWLRKNCGSFHHPHLNLHPGSLLLLAQLLASWEEDAWHGSVTEDSGSG